MSEYVKECIFCKSKIQMSDKSGKWLPYNQDGSQHDCKKEKTELSVEVLLKKLATVGITVDLSRLRNI